MTRQGIRAVLFDAGQTLLRVRPSVAAVYSQAAERHGIRVDAAALERRFRTAWERSFERAASRGFRCSDPILGEEWLEIVRETFGPDVPDVSVRLLFDDLHGRFGTAEAWEVAAGTRETLAALRSLGVRLGILSNWDSRLPRMLDELRLTGSFDVLTISYEVGFEKPHPAIFGEALRRAGTRAEDTLYVGDSLKVDILPARELGMSTLWLAPEGERRAHPEGGRGMDRLPEAPEAFWSEVVARRGVTEGEA